MEVRVDQDACAGRSGLVDVEAVAQRIAPRGRHPGNRIELPSAGTSSSTSAN
jgi:hypothetical protein